jgi:P27 family predicted phage terminase small subunit
MRGSTNIKKLRSVENEPIFAQGVPIRPDFVNGYARRIWYLLTKMLDSAGMLTKADGGALARYCVNFAEWRQTVKEINDPEFKRWLVLEGRNYRTVGYAPHPSLKYRIALEKHLREDERLFGLNPSARASLGTQLGLIKEKKSEDDKMRFFKSEKA